MQIFKSFKYQPPYETFASRGFSVQVTHDEIGLADPTDIVSLRDVYAELSMEVEALIVLEQVKLGRIPSDAVSEALKPWLLGTKRQPTTSPITAQG